MTDDLSTRLLEAITRREWAAREAQPGPWHIGNAVDPTQPCNIHTVPGCRGVAYNVGWLDAEHIIWHDPSHVLRVCQAHREIVEHWQATKDALSAAEGTILAGACRVRLGAYENVLKALAGAYGLEESP